MTAKTLFEVLETRARQQADQEAVRYADRALSFGGLWQAARRFATLVHDSGVEHGDRVLLVLPNGLDFVVAFLGAQLAGGVAVPLFPDSGAKRVEDLCSLSGARAIVAPHSQSDRLGEVAGRTGRLLLLVEESVDLPAQNDRPLPRSEDLSFIQYTSGSTGDPKGVQLSQHNLLCNLEQMVTGMEITDRDVFVSWLPVHHDMGLVLMAMAPLFVGARLVLLPTNMHSIRSWMEAMAEHGGTFTAGPDFAYRMCAAYAKEPPAGRLGALRVALNAAEPVRVQTMADFEQRFGLRQVMVAGYGLAEATVGVSMWPPGASAKVDARGLVSVGRGFPGVEIRVVGDGGVVGAREQGEIVVRSPAATRGYLGNPAATAALAWRDGFIRTGDMGYLDEAGDLFIVGRLKNVIIHGGHNVAPQEIEETVDRLPFVRRTAAVGVDRGRIEGEQVVVMAELRAADVMGDSHEQAIQIVRAFRDRLGFRPARVVLLRPRAIPMTANGKIRHSALRQGLLDGSLRDAGNVVFPEY